MASCSALQQGVPGSREHAAADTPRQMTVPVILDGVVGAARQVLGNGRPTVAQLSVLFHDGAFLLGDTSHRSVCSLPGADASVAGIHTITLRPWQRQHTRSCLTRCRQIRETNDACQSSSMLHLIVGERLLLQGGVQLVVPPASADATCCQTHRTCAGLSVTSGCRFMKRGVVSVASSSEQDRA